MGFLFLNTEGHHTWEVPDDVTEARFALWGASWGGGTGVTISDLVPGEILHLNLGGNGINSGWNGGGASTPVTAGGIFSTGGGGATDLRRGGNSLSDRVAVAGGDAGPTAYFSTGIGLAGRSGGGPPGGDWPGTYWVYAYDRGDGVMEYRYETPGYVDPDGNAAAGPYPISDYMYGNEPPSGPNGADTVSHTIVSYGRLPANPDPFPPVTITVHLGAGGGGYTGGEGGEMWFRQADPFFNPTNMNQALADLYNGAPGTNWTHPSLAGYDHGAPRPDLPEGGLFYATRLLPGAVFIAWDETLEQQQWRVGRIGPQWNP